MGDDRYTIAARQRRADAVRKIAEREGRTNPVTVRHASPEELAAYRKPKCRSRHAAVTGQTEATGSLSSVTGTKT